MARLSELSGPLEAVQRRHLSGLDGEARTTTLTARWSRTPYAIMRDARTPQHRSSSTDNARLKVKLKPQRLTLQTSRVESTVVLKVMPYEQSTV